MADIPEVIDLNVGGVLYATTRTTLARDPTSVLGRWFSTNANATSGIEDTVACAARFCFTRVILYVGLTCAT